MKFHVPGISCGHCTAAIGRAIKAIDPNAKIDSHLTSKTVTIASTKMLLHSNPRHEVSHVIGSLDLGTDHMRQAHLCHFPRNPRLFRCPIAKG
ncbi:heavy-metal-associated domain-containing protein [Aquicoccus porphyridii]|uniref:Heavy-metal-associated domain-containing protein n=1 Tax=Aquicoccus porphyridii TaxID=1852029 RepID=A0A5A9YXZ1_9RHOB|nr:heavy-metal-associated domain-containing protein [Aquicoccus porphyridii]RAI51986.1 hypothetical protein DOO74_20075 [Rhodobacteraceae bacterium AsT-22]